MDSSKEDYWFLALVTLSVTKVGDRLSSSLVVNDRLYSRYDCADSL